VTDETYSYQNKLLFDLCDDFMPNRIKTIKRLKAINRKDRQTAERERKTSRRAYSKAEKGI